MTHKVEREHPLYRSRRAMWRKYGDLYAGGEQMKANAGEYLIRRNAEAAQIYSERLSQVFYENYIGSVVDWYAATLMRREPVLLFEGHDEQARHFFDDFAEDCDRKGTNIAAFFRQQFVNALVYGGSYLVVDFPRGATPASNRAEEDESGISRAFLVDYKPEEVINWSHDSSGKLEWVVLRTSCLRQDDLDHDWRTETRWIHYDRENFQIYRRATESSPIELVDGGRHGLAGQQRVPLFRFQVSEGLWLMNKAALLQLEHFNKANALSWALSMGLFATPVIYSDREFKQILGESYYLQLEKDDRFGWTEPEGHVFQIASDNLLRLKDEIYRVCYLMSQAGSTATGNLGQSAASKQRDFSVTQEVLRAYGDMVKDTMKQVLRAIALARKDELKVDVSGLDEFDIGDIGAQLEDAQKLLALGIPSDTLKKQLFKKVAFQYFCDVRQEVKDRMAREIEGE